PTFAWSSPGSVPISRQHIRVQTTAGRNSSAVWSGCSAGWGKSMIGLAESGRGGMGGAFAWAVVGNSDTLGGYVALVGVPDPLRARLQRQTEMKILFAARY